MESSDPLDPPYWNYAEDLRQLQFQLDNLALEDKDRAVARYLIRSCLGITLKPIQEQSSLSSMTKKAEESVFPSENNVIQEKGVDGMNPLEIPLILEHVLGYLPVNDLLHSRLVSQSWNSKSIPWIRIKKDIVIVKPDEFLRFFQSFKEATLLPFTKLGVRLEKLSIVPCLRFFTKHGASLEQLTIKDEEQEHYSTVGDQKLENFMKLRHIFKHVSNLKKLTLDFSDIPDPDFDEDYEELNEDESLFGELSDLVLHKVVSLDIWARYSAFSKRYLDGLFKMVPNVKVLRVADFYEDEQFYEPFASALKNVNLSSVYRQEEDDRPELLKVFADTQRLKKLSMWLDLKSPFDSQLVDTQQEFLRSQAETLEELRLIGKQDPDDDLSHEDFIKLRIPNMKILHSVTLSLDPVEIENYSLISHVPFCIVPIEPEQVPCLRSIRVDHRIFGRSFQDSVFRRVQEIDLGGWRQVNCEVLPEVTSRCPGLKKLTNLCSTLNEKEMALIAANLQNLEVLELDIWDRSGLPKMQDLNFVISGIPVGSKWIVAQLEDRVRISSAMPWIEPPGPSFRDLKSLTKLRLSFDFDGKEECFARIDEIGVYLTFLRLSPKLKLTLHGNFYISNDLAAKMTSYYQDVYFNFVQKVPDTRFPVWDNK